MNYGKHERYSPPPTGYYQVSSTSTRPGFPRLEFFLVSIAVFLAPMNYLRFTSVYVTLGDVFMFSCLFVMVLNRTLRTTHILGSGSNFWMTGLFMLIGGLLVSSIVNGDPERGLIVTAQYYVAYFIFPLVIVYRPSQQVIQLIRIFIFSMVVLCLHGIYLIHIDGETGTQFVSGSGRLRSFVERENALASLIALTTSLLLWLSAAGYIRQIVAWLTFPLLIYGVMLTGSNTGMLALLYAFVVFGLATISWRRLALGVAVISAVLAALSFWGTEYLPSVFQKRVLGAVESGDIEKAGTFSDRLELIIESQEMINESVLIGVGADQYRVLSHLEHVVHNAYLLIWSEGGSLALVGFLLILLGGLHTALSAFQLPGGRLAAICTFCSVTQFALAVNAFAHPYGRFWVVPLLLAVAVSVAYAQEYPTSRHKR